MLNVFDPAFWIGRKGNGWAAWETRGARKSRTGWGRREASWKNIRAAGGVWEDCMQLREMVRAAIVPELLDNKLVVVVGV